MLLVDKPVGPTSRQVLDRLERRLRSGPLGHAGTLDPLASGLLVVLLGTARRLQPQFLGSDKSYAAELRLGWVSRTLDAEGPVTAGPRPVPDLGDLAALARRFTGRLEQRPPAHSAIRVGGRRAWRAARRGEPVEPPPREVEIRELTLSPLAPDRLALRVRCSAGTYVRSLVRDLGEALGCGAYLAALRRLGSGAFSVDDAVDPDLAEPSRVRPLSAVLHRHGRLEVSRAEAVLLAQGRAVPGTPAPGEAPAFAWHRGEPLCRLKLLQDGQVRSDLRLFDPRSREESASPEGGGPGPEGDPGRA